MPRQLIGRFWVNLLRIWEWPSKFKMICSTLRVRSSRPPKDTMEKIFIKARSHLWSSITSRTALRNPLQGCWRFWKWRLLRPLWLQRQLDCCIRLGVCSMPRRWCASWLPLPLLSWTIIYPCQSRGSCWRNWLNSALHVLNDGSYCCLSFPDNPSSIPFKPILP